MILYQLRCSKGHEFEAWFRDSATYDAQSAGGEVECPHCGDCAVGKAPMAPRLARHGAGEDPSERRAREVARKILDAVDRTRRTVEENFEYVGPDFSDEARRIHTGDAEERDIYGEATDEESDALDEDGIEHHRIPWLPRRDS